ncbi:MAG: DNA polymerase III subunit gamma/tau [Epsilonproteobacteria bacterium]|nr:DNA polymerase III subunit gamma/tau [Campylobacterota bacterium]
MQSASEVLARKYRPKNFEELIGQEAIAQTLSLALDSNRLSHAYLFSGLRGSGKTSTARIFAKALLCEKGVSHQPCEVCENCIMAREGRHMDIVEMDAASSRKIDDIRDLIEQTKYKPAVGRFKIFIIDEVHMLTKEAFNALLKTLEEPPSYVKFILATTDPLKLPATILSRTQHFRFKRIATSKIVSHLRYILELENISYDIEALEILARSGNGSLRDTLTLLDQAIIYSKGHVDVVTVTDMLGLIDPQFLKDIFDAILTKDKQKVIEYVSILEDYEAEMVVDELITYLKERLLHSDGIFSTLLIDRFFRILSQSKSLFALNADGGFVLSLIFFKMIEALKIKEVDALIEQLENSSAQNLPPLEVKNESKENIHQKPIKNTIESSQKPLPKQAEDNGKVLFDQLLQKIKNRSVELGECFEKGVEYHYFKEGVLAWESCVKNECKEKLRYGYSVIKMLVQEIFGIDTKIKMIACSKELDDEVQAPKELPQQYQEDSSLEEDHQQTPVEQNSQEVLNPSSCVASCAGLDEPQNEVNDIMDEPMVQKAMELFEAKKVVIQSKV